MWFWACMCELLVLLVRPVKSTMLWPRRACYYLLEHDSPFHSYLEEAAYFFVLDSSGLVSACKSTLSIFKQLHGLASRTSSPEFPTGQTGMS